MGLEPSSSGGGPPTSDPEPGSMGPSHQRVTLPRLPLLIARPDLFSRFADDQSHSRRQAGPGTGATDGGVSWV
jgi:hypothetical protein